MLRAWNRRIERYVVPVIAVGLAVALRVTLAPVVGQEVPFLLLMAAVMGSAFLGGTVGGLIATGLSVVSVAWLLDPASPWSALLTSGRQLQLVLFVVEAVVITMLTSAMFRARWRAESNAEEAKLLQREVSDAADREQTRIGQDLHDDLGQFLTGVALSGELLATKMERDAAVPPRYVEGCRALIKMMNQSVNRTRQLARGMSPMAVEPDSLPMLLSELKERTAELTGKRVNFETTGITPQLSRSSVLHLFRIAQEAVNNAVKHSGGSEIAIRLTGRKTELELSVTDNGNGVVKAGRGMGMRVMASRAARIGAVLRVEQVESEMGAASSQARGVRVRCNLLARNVGLEAGGVSEVDGDL